MPIAQWRVPMAVNAAIRSPVLVAIAPVMVSFVRTDRFVRTAIVKAQAVPAAVVLADLAAVKRAPRRAVRQGRVVRLVRAQEASGVCPRVVVVSHATLEQRIERMALRVRSRRSRWESCASERRAVVARRRCRDELDHQTPGYVFYGPRSLGAFVIWRFRMR